MALEAKVIQPGLKKPTNRTTQPLPQIAKAPELVKSADSYSYNRDRVYGGWERTNNRTKVVDKVQYAVVLNPTFGTETLTRGSGCGQVNEVVGRISGYETNSAALVGITNLQKLIYKKGEQNPFAENGDKILNPKLVVLTNDGIGLVAV